MKLGAQNLNNFNFLAILSFLSTVLKLFFNFLLYFVNKLITKFQHPGNYFHLFTLNFQHPPRLLLQDKLREMN
jgi:hypothetical protein